MATFKEYDSHVLRHLQQSQLDILLAIDKVCKDNDITYFLDSGTALGAVRHHGFIPWDDDVDIGMLRDDYDRFMSIGAVELGDRFVVSSPRTNDRQAAMFGKVWLKNTKMMTQEIKDAALDQGIFVDVFPYDVLNRNSKIANKQISMGERWQKISYLYHSPNVRIETSGLKGKLAQAFFGFAHQIIRAFFNPPMIMRHIDRAIKMGKDDPSEEYVGLCYRLDRPFPKSMLNPIKRVEFEGHMLPVPNDVEAFLVNEFGDNWRDLPPIDERKNHAPLVIEFEDE